MALTTLLPLPLLLPLTLPRLPLSGLRADRRLDTRAHARVRDALEEPAAVRRAQRGHRRLEGR